MRLFPLPMVLFFSINFSPAFSSERFLLQSELFTNHLSDPPATAFIWYVYDNAGNRMEQRAYNGIDTHGVSMSTTVFSYNADGTLFQKLLTSRSDTLSIVRYYYDADKKVVAIVTLDKSQTVLFIDSLDYNAGNFCTAQRRYENGIKVFYHSFAYDDSNRKISDTLYELSGSLYTAAQAVVFSYDAQSRVNSESHYRNIAGTWYLINTAVMAYTAGALASVTLYEGDGGSGIMQDSLAYQYDAYGNRIREEHFDEERTLVSTIDYTWIDTWPTLSRPAKNYGTSQIAVRYFRGTFYPGRSSAPEMSARIYDMRGKLVMERHSIPGDKFVLPRIGKGNYLAQFTTQTNCASVSFSANY